MLPLNPYISLDNNKYPIAQDSYSMKWSRAFSSQLAGNIIRLNFIDRGPGIRVYDMSLILETWDSNSLPYKAGITAAWYDQLANLETSFGKIATVLQFQDPLGRSPGGGGYGVFFTNYSLSVHKAATPGKSILIAQIEVTEATQVVA